MVNRNVMADISWTKSTVNERQALTFEEDTNPAAFQLRFKQILKYIKSKAELILEFHYY